MNFKELIDQAKSGFPNPELLDNESRFAFDQLMAHLMAKVSANPKDRTDEESRYIQQGIFILHPFLMMTHYNHVKADRYLIDGVNKVYPQVIAEFDDVLEDPQEFITYFIESGGKIVNENQEDETESSLVSFQYDPDNLDTLIPRPSF